MFSGADAKRLAQCRSGLGQIVFFDHPACPYGGKQFVFADRPVTVLDQVHQHVQRLGRERNRGAVRAKQLPRHGIQPEAGEFIQATFGLDRHTPQKNSESFRKFSRIPG